MLVSLRSSLAILFGSIAFAYGSAFILTHLKFGRPGSTSSIGALFVPIYMLIAGGIGFLIGMGLEMLRKNESEQIRDSFHLKFFHWAVYCLFIGGAVAMGVRSVLVTEERVKPALLLNQKWVKASALPEKKVVKRSGILVYGSSGPRRTFAWDKNKTGVFESNYGGLVVSDVQNNMKCEIPIEGLDYVTSVHVASLLSRKGNFPVLVVVVAGRPTGRRAMVAVISSTYELLHLERRNRDWPIGTNPLEILQGDGRDAEIGVLGPRGPSPRAFVIEKGNGNGG